MTMMLADWPEGNEAKLGAKRRELVVGEAFTFRWQGGALALPKLLRAPKGSNAEVDGSTFTADMPGLYRFELHGVVIEAVAFQRRALTLMKRNTADSRPPNLGLRMIANAVTAEEIIERIEVESLEPIFTRDSDGKVTEREGTDAIPSGSVLLGAADIADRSKLVPAHGAPGSLLPCEPQ